MTDYKEDIKQAVEVMRRGGVILYPTDTVWGIGCDAGNEAAVARVFEIKQRIDSKALIVLTPDIDSLWRCVDNVPDVAEQLIETAVRPTTIIYDCGINLASNVTAADGSVAVRVTTDPFCRALCRALRRPIVSTSANISGEPTAPTFADISPEVVKAVDYVVKYRQEDTSRALPSLIIKISDDSTFKILRK